MTVEKFEGGSPSAGWGDLGDVGLEDVGASDIKMPRLVIDHEKMVFRNTTTNEEFPELDAVFLGLIKQRIMWDTQVDDKDRPQCKSPDGLIGFPQLRTDIPPRKQFPWEKAIFNQEEHPPQPDGLIALPCESCNFAEWGKQRERPACSEQYTFPILYNGPSGVPTPATISFQKSGIKSAKIYAGTFKAAKHPMFTVWTKLTLTPESRGKTRYATPIFTRGGLSDAGEWRGWADQYYAVREFLQARPRLSDELDDGATKSRPAPASATAATKLDDDDPWATAAPAASAAAAASSGVADDDLPF
jgi:hypothetical protein